MYENENINGYETHQYTDVTPEAGSMQAPPDKKHKKKKEGHFGAYVKKVLVCTSLGLFFGLCAGLGFYLVVETTGLQTGDAREAIRLEEENENDGEVTDSEDSAGEIQTVPDYSANGGEGIVTEISDRTTPDIKDMVKEVMPAMVSIVNEYSETVNYFGQRLTQTGQSSGSGIIVGQSDTELLLVTNYHVISDADNLKVAFIDGTEAQAQVKGSDADMDLAVLAIKLSDLSQETKDAIAIAPLGDSDSLEMGEYVVAIGNALGYGQSVTDGIVSALNRSIPLADGKEGTFIQTNAAINPGNSGGALLNAKGEVIGINSNKIGNNLVEGMGYAIPISTAKPIIEELMLRETREKVAEKEVGYMGVSYFPVDAESAQIYGWEEGLYIREVMEDSAAQAAGLKTGDIITKIDGNRVKDRDQLERVMQYYPAGETIELEIMRNNGNGYETMKVEITLGERPAEQ